MVHWFRTHLAMQRTQVRSLVREVRYHILQSSEAHTLQLLSLSTTTIEPVCHNKRSRLKQETAHVLRLSPDADE